jgi:hypothetical protein
LLDKTYGATATSSSAAISVRAAVVISCFAACRTDVALGLELLLLPWLLPAAAVLNRLLSIKGSVELLNAEDRLSVRLYGVRNAEGMLWCSC